MRCPAGWHAPDVCVPVVAAHAALCTRPGSLTAHGAAGPPLRIERRYELLESMEPWQGGGEMIQDVGLDHSTYALPPLRFEAGTPAIAEAIGLGTACDVLSSIGMEQVRCAPSQQCVCCVSGCAAA